MATRNSATAFSKRAITGSDDALTAEKALDVYRRKRNFNETSEPDGAKGANANAAPSRCFVVQMHRASHLHYDFRLEIDGVLKSWAVPKGPSLDPSVKRLAVMTEDHPYAYRSFEGEIPAGNYGAGTVIVWDEGELAPIGDIDSTLTGRRRREAEDALFAKQLAKGHLAFELRGKRLNGAFSLVQTKSRGDRQWLLFKKNDDFADATFDIATVLTSARTGQSIDDLGGAKKKTTKAVAGIAGKSKKTAISKTSAPPPSAAVGKPRSGKAPKPHHIKPMLATLADAPFHLPGWVYEIKWDGYRAIAELSPKGDVELYSRNLKDLSTKYPAVVEALESLKIDAVLDGELVMLKGDGNSDFSALQNFANAADSTSVLTYCVFDLLYLNGVDYREKPLVERKAVLESILPETSHLRLSRHYAADGIEFFEAAKKLGLEGIMAKKSDSRYHADARSDQWLKIKTMQRQEVVIGGFTEPKSSGRAHLGALVLGVYDPKGKLVHIGRVGTGMGSVKELAALRKTLEKIETESCPFANPPTATRNRWGGRSGEVHWVEPKLVCEVSFTEWTPDGSLRHPVFVALRDDKKARSVVREYPTAAPSDDDPPEEPTPDLSANRRKEKKSKKASSMAKSRIQKVASAPTKEAGDSQVKLTHLDKVYFPEAGYTKGDLLAFYREIGPTILPYLLGRPQSLNRQPNGIHGESFFQKDMKQGAPDWLQIEPVVSERRADGVTDYLVCNGLDSLLYMVNLGCIEINPWSSRVESLDRPDFVTIDLDPEAVGMKEISAVAIAVRTLCDKLEVETHVKTSGKRGLHVCIPLGARYDYDQGKAFSQLLSTLVHQELPELTSLEKSPRNRQGRVYLDYLRNSQQQTAASVYSVRPTTAASVSTPLLWSEVKPNLDPALFNIRTFDKRLSAKGDLWKPMLGDGIDLPAALKRLAALQAGKKKTKKRQGA